MLAMGKGIFVSTTNRGLRILLLLLVFSLPYWCWGQNVGDYRTKVTGAWNWSSAANWERCVTAGTWVGATSTDYPGQNPLVGVVTIQNGANVTLDVSPANSIGSLVLSNGGTNTEVKIDNYTLSVSGVVSVNSNTNNRNKSITITTGTLNAGSVVLTGNGTQDAFIQVGNGGNINVSGNVSLGVGATSGAYILFSGGGTLNLTGSLSGIGLTSATGGGVNPTSGTVNYSSLGNQAIANYTYFNLACSNGGIKTLPAATVTVGGSLTVSSSTLAFDAGAVRTLNVTGDLSGDGTIDMSSGNRAHFLNLGGASNSIGSLVTGTAASTVTYNRAGNQTVFASSSYRSLAIAGSGTKTMQGDIVVNATFTIGATASFDMSALPNNALYLRGTTNTLTAGGVFVAGTDNQTVYYDGDVNQNMLVADYRNLVVGGSLNTASRTKTMYGSSTITGNLVVVGTSTSAKTSLDVNNFTHTVNGNVVVGDWGTLQLRNNNFSISGTTDISANGSLLDSGGGTNLFTGKVSSLGSWNVPQPCTFSNGLLVNGSFPSTGTFTYTFDTNDQAIEGSSAITLSSIVVATAGKTLTNLTSNGLTVSGTISGVGNFTNGNATTPASLSVTAANPFTLTGTLDLALNPNTVNYSGTGAQTIGAYSFYNLTSSSNGARTLANTGTISISGVFTTGPNFYTTTGSTVSFNGAGAQDIPALNVPYNNIKVEGGSIKTLAGNVTVNTNLILNGAVLELAGYNLTLANTAATAITAGAPFSSTNMISTNGAGFLQKNAAAVAGLQIAYPVGSGGYYSPVTISSIATISPSNIQVRAIPSAINPSYIKKYWELKPSTAVTNATATFTYAADELNGAMPSISFSPDNGATWQNPPLSGAQSFSGTSFTITGTSALSGWWTMGYRTFYSYQTGDWNQPTSWTSDPSGTLQIGSAIPGYNDRVVVLTGRTITLTADVADKNLDVTIDNGGFLDMGAYKFTGTPTNLLALRGQGTLKLASSNFPTAPTNTLVQAGGGTVEYNNSASFDLPLAQATFNNLTINTDVAAVATQKNNLTVFGNLYVKQGNFKINDDASTARRELTVNGDITVDAAGKVSVGKGQTNQAPSGTPPFIDYYDRYSHRVVLKGDFINRGDVRFTNQAYPTYKTRATTGIATVYFQGESNNTVVCDSTTLFYNMIVDKGADQTYSLTITPSTYSHFKLFGANSNSGNTAAPATPENPNIQKALWIRNGSLILDGFTVIPSLSESNSGGTPNGDYFIPANGALILDNPNVIVLGTADSYQEINAAYGLSGGSNALYEIDTDGAYEAISILGKLQVNDGYLSTRESSGIVTWSAASGQLVVNGGFVDIKQLRSDNSGTGKTSYIQNGGQVVLRGRFQRTPASYSAPTYIAAKSVATINTARNQASSDGAVGTLNMLSAGDVFIMTGGLMQIYDAVGAGGRIVDINSAAGNINVSGGSVELIPTSGTNDADAANWQLRSNAPFYNLAISRQGGNTSVVRQEAGYPSLVVKNDFSINTASFNANNLDVTVGGNFSISAGSTYTAGTNTTILNGSGNQTFTVNLAAALALNNFTISKDAGTSVTFAGSQKNINVGGNLRLELATLNDNGNAIAVAKDIYNSGVHAGTGKVLVNGSVNQLIDGNGTFQNLELNNASGTASSPPISLAANVSVNGALTFSQDRPFDIKTYNLKMGASASFVSAGANRYVKTSGTLGDGGITRVYSSASPSFTFPLGTVSTRRPASPAYTPATISLAGTPTAYGSITINPVGYEHPATTNNGRSLTYFWRVKSSGFTLGSATVTHSYKYNSLDVVAAGGDPTEAGYVAARYLPSTTKWQKGNVADVDKTTSLIGGAFLTSKDFIDGDYTAGDDTPTDPFGTPAVFYSCINGAAAGSGLWKNASTWSLTSNTVYSNPSSLVPGINDIVIIGGKDYVSLENNSDQTKANFDYRSCAILQIEKGSTFDIGYNPSSSFGMVLNHPNGNGVFRLTTSSASGSTYAFPSGDFTDFNVNLGTTELYSTNPNPGTTYWLPNGITTYGNLIISPLGGSNIIFPNNDVLVYGNLTTKGQNADSWFCPTWSGNYPTAPTARVAKTITIKGNFDIQGGSFGWYGNNGGGAQNVVVYGDVIVAPLAGIDVWGSNASQRLSIGGSLINNTTNTKPVGVGTNSLCNFSNVDIVFFGDTNASIKNTASTPVTIFNKVTVDKGNSPTTTLTIDIGGTLTTPADSWLTLKNGTLRYTRNNPNSHFTISTTTPFSIPSTAGLFIDYANSGSKRVLIADAPSDVNDLYLDGKLTINNGLVYIGSPTGTANNNDIEYSGGGLSEIEVNGGSLFVNGQIRRNVSSTVGVLKYTQTAGAVTVYGNNPIATRAKLEVLNAGSSFNMSGGKLFVVRGGGTTFGDLYLRPASGAVSGGDIIFTQTPASGTTIDAVQNYMLESNIALNNLFVTGKTAATARNATLTLMVSPLTLKGNLTLSNANSIFVANNRNVTIGGNFTNNGTYTYGTNTTTFNGNTQTIAGISTTDFYDMVVSPVSTLTVSKDFTVNNDLTITSGALNLAANRLTLKGDLVNNGAYTDNNSNGVVLQGTAKQLVSGSGSFGRLMLDNAAGARSLSSISLQNDLVLSKGIFDINQYQLTLSQTSSIGGAPFDVTKMVVTDGVASNLGMRKFFASNPAAAFTFPIGVNGKYTPAILNITASSTVGYISIMAVNSNHPAVLDPNNVLHYYWKTESSGITGFKGSVTYQYLAGDVAGGPEADYVAANLMLPGSFWSKATTGAATDNVDETLHQARFNFNGVSNLSGDYTAGLDPALPDDVPSYRSVKNGSWTDVATWEPVGASPPCPAGGPNGFNVIIDHEVTADASYCFAYQTTINGKLKMVKPFFGHNLGNVDGTGTIYLEAGNLPAGNFDSFLDCSNNGTIEYGGDGTYTVIASQFDAVPNMVFSGTGNRILPAKDLTICRRFVINGPTVDNSVNNRKLTMLGSVERYGSGFFMCGSGPNAIVSLSGTTPQTIGGPLGDFYGSCVFATLEINNSSGVIIGTNGVIATSKLRLTKGNITTSASNKLYVFGGIGAATPANGTPESFVNGPLLARITPGSYFQYPVGKGTDLSHPVTVYSNAASTLYWSVEYFSPNATYASATAPLVDVNQTEYWAVRPDGIASAPGKIKLGWDTQSDLNPLMTINGMPDMRVALYNTGTSKWEEQVSSVSGTNSLGDVINSAVITIPSSSSRFTTATVSSTRPIASLNPGPSVCGSSGIPVKVTKYTAISFPYTITYSIDGTVQAPITINAMPYTIPTSTFGEYKLLTFKYNGGAANGVVNTTTATAYQSPTASNAGIDQSQCSSTHVYLNANNPAPYAGAWSIVSGAGGNVINSNSSSSEFIGIAGNTYTLRWTITNGTCKSTDDVVIAFPLMSQKPGAFTASPKNVCQGSTGKIYSVPNQPGTTYTWSYSGGGVTITGSSSSVSLDFSGTSTSGTLSVTATNSCGATSDPRTVNVTVIPPPTVTLDPVCIPSGFAKPLGCAEGTTVLKVTADAGQSYTWNMNGLGGFTPANGVDVSQISATWLDNATLFPSSAPNPTTLDTTVKVTVLNLSNGCSTSLNIPITIFRRVQTGPPYHVGNNVAK